ncbi:uncharacterized protein LOC122243892 [Penaeus japonicus]|uniref:uncharacterized protein LOC122243892 n=1 Tax=Penaeus japonicus TaxID=27405 RepID=UPI001C715FCE|nr:uncharacterized protein LOC122243892 [Penaeus japonicus]
MQSTRIEETMDLNPRTFGLNNANIQQNELESTSSSNQNVVQHSAPQPQLQNMPLNGLLNVSDQPHITINQDQDILKFCINNTEMNETLGNLGPSEPNSVSEYTSIFEQNVVQNSALPLNGPLNVSGQPQITNSQDQNIVLLCIDNTEMNETLGNLGPSEPNSVSEYTSIFEQNVVQNSALPLNGPVNVSGQPQITNSQDQVTIIFIPKKHIYLQPSEPNPANHQQNVSESAKTLNQNMVLNSAPQHQLQNVPLNAIEYKSDQQQSTIDQALLYNLVQYEGDENSQHTTDVDIYAERISSRTKQSDQATNPQHIGMDAIYTVSQPKVDQQFVSQPKAQQPLMYVMQPNGEVLSIDETESSVCVQSHVPTVSANASACNLEGGFLWVELAATGEGLKQFLRKNWKEMLKRLPVPRPMNHDRLYEWQKKEPEDPEELEKWLSAIKQKYWRVMKKSIKIPTNEEEGKIWQQKFEAECKTNQRNY